jgi:hypothetical protein
VKAIAIHATANSVGKSDASGAFKPEALAFQKHWIAQGAACARFGFDNRRKLPDRAAEVEGILATQSGLELVALFCHGLRRSLQTGHSLATVKALADAIARASGPRVVVALYACSTAHEVNVQRGGFADALRDELARLGKTGWVDAHSTAGHSTENPHVQRFDICPCEIDEVKGDWIVPKGPLWRSWVRALDTNARGLRFRFPTMAVDEVRAEVGGGG